MKEWKPPSEVIFEMGLDMEWQRLDSLNRMAVALNVPLDMIDPAPKEYIP